MPQHLIGYKRHNTFDEHNPAHVEADQRYHRVFIPVLRTAWRAATGQERVDYYWDYGPKELREYGSNKPIEVPEGITIYGTDASVMTEDMATQTGLAIARSWREFAEGEELTRRFPAGFVLGRFAVDLTELAG